MTTMPIISIPVLPGKNGSGPRYLHIVNLDGWDAMPKKEFTQEEIDSNPRLKNLLEMAPATDEQIAALEAAMLHSRGHY